MQLLTDIDWAGKIAVLRVDMNVPTDGDVVTDASRIAAVAPTIKHILTAAGGVVVLTHRGRPKEGEFDQSLSTKGLVAAVSAAVGRAVKFQSALADKADGACQPQEVVLLENTRFNLGEKADSDELAKIYAQLGDVFVMDAFASAHRAEASVTGIARHLPSCAGLLLMAEINALKPVMLSHRRPYIGILGGAKVASKLAVLNQMASSCDKLLVGGGIANTLLAASGYNMGQFPEKEQTATQAMALQILQTHRDTIVLPTDVVVADSTDAPAGQGVAVEAVKDNQRALDIGAATIATYQQALAGAQTILWNGPVGLFEKPPFANGTKAIATALAAHAGYTLVGGGDTIAACNYFNLSASMSHISTGGGALLEYLAQGSLPGIDAVA